jgi:thiol-disulfide isomerase/thioredoxin
MSDDKPFNKQIAYMEDFDFEEDGSIKDKLLLYINKYIPVVIMVQSGNCVHCQNAKPAFQDYANRTSRNEVICATIDYLGSRNSQKQLVKRIEKVIPKAATQGIPCYALFKNGVLVTSKEIKGRCVESLGEFTGVKAKRKV